MQKGPACRQAGSALIFLLVGIVVLSAIAGAFYLGKSTTPKPSPSTVATTQVAQSPTTSVNPAPNGVGETANWKTYTNSQYGYSVKYPSLLSQNETQNDTYLSFIYFSRPNEDSYGFSIEVRSSTLSDEIKNQKSQIEGHVLVRLTKEKEITLGGFRGVLLEYTPDQPDNGTTRRFVIVNNGKYSYTISGNPQTLDQILSTFKFTN